MYEGIIKANQDKIMIKSKLISTVVISVLAFSVGIAFAQTANTVNVTSTPVTTSPASGSSGTTLGTFTLTGNNGATYSVTSIPIMLAVAGGGQPTELSGCQLFNASNVGLNTGNNAMNALVNGTNTITLDQPLTVNGSGSTFTLRCNVSSSQVTGSTYQFTAGTPVFTTTSTTSGTGGALGATLTTVPSVNTGVQNAVLALITLDAGNSNQNVNVTSIPVTLSFSGAMANDYSNCSIRSASNLATALNNGSNSIATPVNGSTGFTLDTPLSVSPGSAQILALTCSISSAAAPGSTVTVSLAPASIAANASSGSISPTVLTGSDGVPASTSGTIEITAPNTTVTTPVTTTAPGAPNTGAGGDMALNIIVLAASLGVITLGAVLLKRRQA